MPESFEGRERISRLEERVDSNRRQIEMLGPLPLQVGLIQRGQDDLREDMAELRRDIDARFQRQEGRQQKWEEELRRSIGNQFATCQSEIAKIADTMREHHEASAKRRELEREKREEEAGQTSLQRIVARYGLITGLTVVLISSITSLIIAFFGGS